MAQSSTFTCSYWRTQTIVLENISWLIDLISYLRMGEVEFSNGALKDKLISRVAAALALYPRSDDQNNKIYSLIFWPRRLTIVVEWEKLKAGEREKSGGKTKQAQLTCSQLTNLEGVALKWSSNQSETALLLSKMARLEADNGMGLPRGLKPTQTQEEVAKWLQVGKHKCVSGFLFCRIIL